MGDDERPEPTGGVEDEPSADAALSSTWARRRIRVVLLALTLCVISVSAAVIVVSAGWPDEYMPSPTSIAFPHPGDGPGPVPSVAPTATPFITDGVLQLAADGTPSDVRVTWTDGPDPAVRVDWQCHATGSPCTSEVAVPAGVDVSIHARHSLVGRYPFLLRFAGICDAEVDPRPAIESLATGTQPDLAVPTACEFLMPAEGAYLELGYGFVNWGLETIDTPPFTTVLFCETYAYPEPIPSPLPGCPDPPDPTPSPTPSVTSIGSLSPAPTESPR